MKELFSRLIQRCAISFFWHLEFSTRSSHILKKRGGEGWRRG